MSATGTLARFGARSLALLIYPAGWVMTRLAGYAAREEAARLPHPRPSYNHTRADGPLDPCPACATEQSPAERDALHAHRLAERRAVVAARPPITQARDATESVWISRTLVRRAIGSLCVWSGYVQAGLDAGVFDHRELAEIDGLVDMLYASSNIAPDEDLDD